MYWETNEETEAETGVNENNKKNDTKPRSVGRGHKHLGVCCLQVLFFFRRSGCRHVTGREIRTAVWPPAGGARGGNVRLMQDNRAGQTTQWWKEKFLDASCICDALCCAAQQMISLKSASAVCHNAAANKIRAWSFSKMTSLAKHPDYYKKLVFLFSLINNKWKESYPLVCVPVR